MSTRSVVENGTPPCNMTGRCSEPSFTDPSFTEPSFTEMSFIKTTQGRALMAVYLSAILILSVVFNSTLCLMFYRKAHLLNVSNCFVLNLICCQLCISVIILPMCLVTVVTQNIVVSGAWCDVQGFCFTVTMVANQMALLAISIDRNYAIMNSLRYPNVFTQKLCIIVISVSWTTAVLLAIPPMVRYNMGRYRFHPYRFLCTLDWSSNSGYLVIFCTLSFGLPICIQSFCYVRILTAALGHSKHARKIYPAPLSCSRPTSNIETALTSLGSVETIESVHGSIECKAVRTILVIATTYGICWVPYFTESFLGMSNISVSPNFSAAATCLVFATGILNPMIYAYMNRVTRREIGKFLRGHYPLSNSDERVSTSISAYTPTWLSRTRPNMSGVVNNEMETIIEEKEESVHGDSRVENHSTLTLSVNLPSVKRILPVDKCMDFSKTDFVTTHSEIVICTAKESCIADSKRLPDAVKDIHNDNSVNTGQGNSICDIIRTETAASDEEQYSSKQKRKKKLDYGSFLYFENIKPEKQKSPSINLKTVKHHELDLSSYRVPSICEDLKFRFDFDDNENVNNIANSSQIRTVYPRLETGYGDSTKSISANVTSSSNSGKHEHINNNGHDIALNLR